MNKQYKIIDVLLLIVSLCLMLLLIIDNYVTSDQKKFKLEYEKYNGKESLLYSKKYPTIEIPITNNIEYTSYKKVIKILEKGTGVVFLSYPQCIKSRIIISDFLNDAKKMNVDKIYYANIYSIRDEKKLIDNKVETIKKGTNDYYKILELLGENKKVYKEVGDDSSRIYLPAIIFVKNGNLESVYQSSSDSDEQSFKKMTKKERKEFRKTIRNNIRKIR